MCLLYRALLTLLISTLLATAQTSPAPQTSIRWYGEGFIYITSSVGMRVALDPYGEANVDYEFPPQLQADVVLLSNESDECSGGDRLFGSPQIFRSETAVGINKARGTLFRGVESYLDNEKGSQLGFNTCYSFTLDGIRFGHLGFIGHRLSAEQVHQLGTVDVLCLPVGNPALSVDDMKKMITDLDAKVIIPIAYATVYNKKLTLRPLDDFLKGLTNVKYLDSNEFSITAKTLPSVPTIFVLKTATQQ